MNHEDRRSVVFADFQRSFEYYQKTVICTNSVLSRVHFGYTAMKCWYRACQSGNFRDFKYFFENITYSVLILVVVVLLCSLFRLYVCKKKSLIAWTFCCVLLTSGFSYFKHFWCRKPNCLFCSVLCFYSSF